MANTRREENLDEGNNNGLEGTVEILERIYTDKDQPGASPSLDESLRCVHEPVYKPIFLYQGLWKVPSRFVGFCGVDGG